MTLENTMQVVDNADKGLGNNKYTNNLRGSYQGPETTCSLSVLQLDSVKQQQSFSLAQFPSSKARISSGRNLFAAEPLTSNTRNSALFKIDESNKANEAELAPTQLRTAQSYDRKSKLFAPRESNGPAHSARSSNVAQKVKVRLNFDDLVDEDEEQESDTCRTPLHDVTEESMRTNSPRSSLSSKKSYKSDADRMDIIQSPVYNAEQCFKSNETLDVESVERVSMSRINSSGASRFDEDYERSEVTITGGY